jgi:preprotein translocase subunit SecA
MPFNRILNKIAWDYNQKHLNACKPIVQQINAYCVAWKDLSDSAIQHKTIEFKERLAQGASLDSLLPEAFATVKEACRRLVGTEVPVKDSTEIWAMVPYDVQLIGGMILHEGNIAEMRTGEGKTLVATLPAYLNALTGKGVHIVTVNDYLASRDAEWMWHLYRWLWLTVGAVTKSTPLDQRRTAYEQDITYVENSELGFDYLRDNLAKSNNERSLVWRPLNYAIVDEVDSILIDEARTPLIISQPSEEPTEKYVYYAKIVQMLTPAKGKKKVSKWFLSELLKEDLPTTDDEDTSGDYHIDEKTKTATLTSEGIAKLEQLLKVENLYRDIGYQEIHHIENALKAQAVYHKDKEYLIREGEILLVDEHTWRVMPGRRFSQGLHQAIEAKENVQVQRESKTLATITYQHFLQTIYQTFWYDWYCDDWGRGIWKDLWSRNLFYPYQQPYH